MCSSGTMIAGYRILLDRWPQAIGHACLFGIAMAAHPPAMVSFPGRCRSPKRLKNPVPPPRVNPTGRATSRRAWAVDVLASCQSGEFNDNRHGLHRAFSGPPETQGSTARSLFNRGWAYHSLKQSQQRLALTIGAISIGPGFTRFFNEPSCALASIACKHEPDRSSTMRNPAQAHYGPRQH